jgi:hypothetical protein
VELAKDRSVPERATCGQTTSGTPPVATAPAGRVDLRRRKLHHRARLRWHFSGRPGARQPNFVAVAARERAVTSALAVNLIVNRLTPISWISGEPGGQEDQLRGTVRHATERKDDPTRPPEPCAQVRILPRAQPEIGSDQREHPGQTRQLSDRCNPRCTAIDRGNWEESGRKLPVLRGKCCQGARPRLSRTRPALHVPRFTPQRVGVRVGGGLAG